MNALSVSAAAGMNYVAMFIIASFLLKLVLIKFSDSPAGQGLAALVL